MRREKNKTRRRLVRPALKWAGVVLSVVIGSAFVASRWWNFHYYPTGKIGLHVYGGCAVVHVYPKMSPDFASRTSGSIGVESRSNNNRSWDVLFDFHLDHTWTWLRLPLWIPFLLVTAPTAWLFYSDRRVARLGPNACKTCGYDLRGLGGGTMKCPECGSTRAVV